MMKKHTISMLLLAATSSAHAGWLDSAASACSGKLFGLIEQERSEQMLSIRDGIEHEFKQLERIDASLKYDTTERLSEFKTENRQQYSQHLLTLEKYRNTLINSGEVVTDSGETLKDLAATEFVRIWLSRGMTSLHINKQLEDLELNLIESMQSLNQDKARLNALRIMIDGQSSTDAAESACYALSQIKARRLGLEANDYKQLRRRFLNARVLATDEDLKYYLDSGKLPSTEENGISLSDMSIDKFGQKISSWVSSKLN